MKNLIQRSQALDVLRGLTVTLMIMVNTPGTPETAYSPFLHATWHGLTLTDLVFPSFMFVVGTALSFTLEKYQAMSQGAMLKKIFTRTALIFLLGFLLYWFPYFNSDESGHLVMLPLENTRIFGVLQRIALGYCAASLILHYWKERGAIIFSVLALLGYWLVMVSFGDYSLTGNAVLKFDKFLMGESHLYHGEGLAFDPEGALSTLPSIVNVIAGYFAGRFLRAHGAAYDTIAKFLMVGALCIVTALIWDSVFPINKKLWTSSYVLCTVGIDLCLLAILTYLIDLIGNQRWAYFFEVFGRNTLFIYLLSEYGLGIFDQFHIGELPLVVWMQSAWFQSWAGLRNGSLLFALAYMLACWCVAYGMDKRKMYIKL